MANRKSDTPVILKVLKTFRDKKTGKIYQPGEEIETTQGRYLEIKRANDRLVEFIREADHKPVITDDKDGGNV